MQLFIAFCCFLQNKVAVKVRAVQQVANSRTSSEHFWRTRL
jgi:hypothetical protein